MIHGTVIELQARIKLILQAPAQSDVEIDCVIDTGFEGFLTLPPRIVADLNLPHLVNINANLADNSNVETQVHAATIVWQGSERRVAVLAMGRRPLIGTALLEDYHLSIDSCESGTVLIDQIL